MNELSKSKRSEVGMSWLELESSNSDSIMRFISIQSQDH